MYQCKNYDARAQPLFSSLNLLISDVPVAVAVVVFLKSLIKIPDPKTLVLLALAIYKKRK